MTTFSVCEILNILSGIYFIKVSNNVFEDSAITTFTACETPDILRVIYFIKIIIDIIKIVVPIGLIIMISLDCVKGVVTSEKKVGDILKVNKNRIISAILIFCIPMLVNIVLKIIDEETSYESCWVNANSDDIEKYQVLWDAEEERRKKEEEEKNNIPDNPIDINNPGGSNNINVYSGVTSINTSDLGCTLYYTIGTVKSSTVVNKEIAEELHEILVDTCSYINSIDHASYLQTAGTYTGGAFSTANYHTVGLAIDLNNLWTYTSPSGKQYTPYGGQGNNTWGNYQKFVCEVCNGKENCEYNTNYMIYYKYFKPKGWCWGGNWSPKYFDPMHFEKSITPCAVEGKQPITCS